VPCGTSRVVPGAHQVVGPGTHRGNGPREVHTTEQPPKKKRKRSAKKKAEAKTDEEIEGSVRKEVKDFFEKAKERRK
jgi:hypothetical protein